MPATTTTLWQLVLDRNHIDPLELAAALEDQLSNRPLDFRTRLLIRDSLDALSRRWGATSVSEWLDRSPYRHELEEMRKSDLGPAGFPSLEKRIVQTVKPESVRQLLRELGVELSRDTRIDVGGSIALILEQKLSRRTEDIDVVNEVPAEIRSRHDLLDRLADRYHLRITHFQSHYLPSGWEQRLHSFGVFGRLTVFLVDPYDIFVGKLFSAREKDRDDLRELTPQLQKPVIERRLSEAATNLMANAKWTQDAQRNWYVLYGEPLPSP